MSETNAPTFWDELEAKGRNWTDSDYVDAAVGLVLSVMRSASTKKIPPVEWWSRAKSAMEVAASQAETIHHMISRMGERLQIESYAKTSGKEISSLGQALRDADTFEAFRYVCQRDALYIVAIAQTEHNRMKAEKEEEA